MTDKGFDIAWYMLIKFCILIYFNIVQSLVCKMVTRVAEHHFCGSRPFSEMLITVEPHYFCIHIHFLNWQGKRQRKGKII